MGMRVKTLRWSRTEKKEIEKSGKIRGRKRPPSGGVTFCGGKGAPKRRKDPKKA